MTGEVNRQLKIEAFCGDGSLVIQNGFACGDWNDAGKGVLQLRPFNISTRGTIDLTATKFAETNRDLTPYMLRPRDVIFNNTNSEELVGKLALWTRSERAVLSNHMTILRVAREDRLSPEFLAFYLLKRWFDRYFHSICRRHVNQASVSIERVCETDFPPFTVVEQRKIAGVLSLVQRAIDQQERLLALTAELRKALLEQLFAHGLRHEPQKQTELGPIPESWELRSIDELKLDYRGRIAEGGMMILRSRCHHCGEPFTALRRSARYCCPAHRVAAHRNGLKPRNANPPSVTKPRRLTVERRKRFSNRMIDIVLQR
jgi:hypothetical protein